MRDSLREALEDISQLAHLPDGEAFHDPLQQLRTIEQLADKVLSGSSEQLISDEGKRALKLLAGAMKKVLPPQILQEVIDHCDPLTAFLRDGFGVTEYKLTTEEREDGNGG